MRPSGWRRAVLAATGLATLGAVTLPGSATAQEVGREAVERLRYPELRFDPPVPEVHTLPSGVTVYFVEDRSLPLVTVLARFSGGFSHFGREYYAAGTALPGLLRSGGTRTLAPDSVDKVLEYYAIQTSFGGAGESTFSSVNTLVEHLDVALEVWGDLLKRPGFDSGRVEVWRGRELENVLRRLDDPGRLAFSEFNRLMFGDHPIGWELAAEDLEPSDLAEDRLRHLHERILCPDNLLLGVTGDVGWDAMEPRLEALTRDWPPCPEPLGDPPSPEIRDEPGVFVIPRELEQTTVVLAHATPLRQGDTRDYFASRIGNAILGASGFSSRLVSRVRTERGYAYSVGSLWTAPARNGGIVGATTRTAPASTLDAIRLIKEVVDEMTREPPERDEVETAVEEATNGFVFNFQAPSQVISRRMFYEAAGLPTDWLERYLEGIQAVRPRDVLSVFRRQVHPDDFVILVVGDPERMGDLASLGPLTVLDLEAPAGGTSPEGEVTSPPSGWPRSRR